MKEFNLVTNSSVEYTCQECGSVRRNVHISVGYPGFKKCYCILCIKNFLLGNSTEHITNGKRDKNTIRFMYRWGWIKYPNNQHYICDKEGNFTETTEKGIDMPSKLVCINRDLVLETITHLMRVLSKNKFIAFREDTLSKCNETRDGKLVVVGEVQISLVDYYNDDEDKSYHVITLYDEEDEDRNDKSIMMAFVFCGYEGKIESRQFFITLQEQMLKNS